MFDFFWIEARRQEASRVREAQRVKRQEEYETQRNDEFERRETILQEKVEKIEEWLLPLVVAQGCTLDKELYPSDDIAVFFTIKFPYYGSYINWHFQQDWDKPAWTEDTIRSSYKNSSIAEQKKIIDASFAALTSFLGPKNSAGEQRVP